MRNAALALLLVTAVLGPLWSGGVPAGAQAAFAAACGLALFLAIRSLQRSRPLRPGLSWIAPALVAAAALLQCVPLPGALLGLLSPVAWGLRTFPPAAAPAFAPLTLDLAATLAALAHPLAVTCALLAAALLSRETNARLLLGAAPVAAAVAQALLALGRWAGEGKLQGAFANRNHLAALLVAGALCALGAALQPPPRETRSPEEPSRPERVLWGAAAALCATVALLTASRGAAVSLFAGALLLLFLLRRPETPGQGRRRRRSSSRPAAWLALALATAALAAALLAPAGSLQRLTGAPRGGLSSELKLRSFRGAVDVALDHWLTGAGRGAWRLVAERHRSVPGELAFVYVENEPLQLAAEVGLPGALLVLACAAAAFVLAQRRADGGLAKGAVAAAFACALHNLVDFNLAFAGVAVPLALAYAAAAAVPQSQQEPRSESPPAPDAGAAPPPAPPPAPPRRRGWEILFRLERWRMPRPLALSFAAGSVGAALLALWAAPLQAERAGASLSALALDLRTPADALLAEARVEVARHPADWVVSLAPALGLLQRTPPRTAEALAWAGRAQLLAPHSWRAHAVTAAVLARGGRRSQARVEAKLGLSELGGTTYAEPLQVAASVANTVEEALEATPDDAHVRADLVRLLLDQRRAPLAVGLAEAELQRLGPDPAPADRAAWGELKARRAFVLLDQQRFAEAAAEAAGLPRTECLGPAIAARAARGLGKPEQEVERLLLSGLADCPGGSDLAQALVRGRLSRGDGPGALALLDLPAVGGPQVGWPADAHLWRAEALELLGRQREALRERWLAAVMAPGRAELGLAYAERLRSAGDLDGALAALRRLAMTAPEEARKVLLDRAADLDRQRLMQALPGYPSLAPRPPPSPPTPAAP